MASSAPSSTAIRAFSSLLVVAMTVAPTTFFATCMAAVPTPLEADRMSAVSHGFSPALRISSDHDGRKTVGSDAACS